MAKSNRERVQKHREALREAGLHPIQIWVPDIHKPEFVVECRRQSKLAAKTDKEDSELHDFMDSALIDIDGWTE